MGGELDERRLGFGFAKHILVALRRLRDNAERGQGLAFPDGQSLPVEEDVALVAEGIA